VLICGVRGCKRFCGTRELSDLGALKGAIVKRFSGSYRNRVAMEYHQVGVPTVDIIVISVIMAIFVSYYAYYWYNSRHPGMKFVSRACSCSSARRGSIQVFDTL